MNEVMKREPPGTVRAPIGGDNQQQKPLINTRFSANGVIQ